MATRTKTIQILLTFLLPIHLLAQAKGNILIIADKECELTIDGEKKSNLIASQPLKVELEEGEHYIQCICLDKIEKAQVVSVESVKQKVIKIQFTESEPSKTVSGNSGNKKLEPILVANLNFTIPGQVLNVLTVAGGGEKGVELPTFVYAFEEGDEVHMDCTLENEKGSIVLEVTTEPENLTIYSNRDFKKMSNEKFIVNKRGIYKFVFSTNHGWDRKGRFTIKRVPKDESKISFNTTAIKKKQFKTVTIQEPSTHFVNSISNEDFKGGKSRIVIPVNLPNNTIEWYYIISSTRDEQEIKSTMKQFHLLGDLNKAVVGLNPTTTAVNIAMNLITQPPGANYCDIYLLDYANQGSFLAKQKFSCLIQGSRENVTSAAVKIDCCKTGQYYLAIKNPDSWYGIYVGIEIVAIVADEGYQLD
jgi:hypothetical protein